MSSSPLLHRGSREVSLEELSQVASPDPTDTWYPLRHRQVLDTVVDTLKGGGFEVQRQTLALARGGARFFGTLDLSAAVAPGVNLSVGVRNSIDKSFPIGLCMGERVFVCDNLSFGSDILITKKHTRFAEERFREGVSQAVLSLHQYRQTAQQRIARLRSSQLTHDVANSLILTAWEEEIISSRQLSRVIEAYRNPAHDDFGLTAWGLLNAMTGVLKEIRQPVVYASRTIKLQALLDSEATTVTPCLGGADGSSAPPDLPF